MLTWPSTDLNLLTEKDRLWCGAAALSTAFQPYKPSTGDFPASFQLMLEQCEKIYQKLHPHRLH
jgi:hypothetical protein